MNGESNKYNFTFEQGCQLLDDLFKDSKYFRGIAISHNAYPVDDDPVRANNMSELLIGLAASVVAEPQEEDEPAIQEDIFAGRNAAVAGKIEQQQVEAQSEETDLEGLEPDDMTTAGDEEDDEEVQNEWSGQTLLDEVTEAPEDEKLIEELNRNAPVTFRLEHIEDWSIEERLAAYKWAYAQELRKAWGDEVTVPPCPECVGNTAHAIRNQVSADIQEITADEEPGVIDLTGEQDAAVPTGDEVAASKAPKRRKRAVPA